ncbi:AAA family ATPase [Pantoea agglomerans]|uniref:AAA family ATPase n=1 Tax=Enterobacter agglomerans TaxID=549 RepID=UPI003BF58046
MNQLIGKISGKIPLTNRFFEIELGGRNLIITGGNGAGKTRLINNIHNQLYNQLLNPEHMDVNYHLSNITNTRKQLSNFAKGTASYKHLLNEIEKHKNFIDEIKGIEITLIDVKKKLHLSKNIKSLLRFYPADRKSQIQEPSSALSLDRLVEQEYQENFDSNAGAMFENYLVSYKTFQSHQIAINKDLEAGDLIATWFEKIRSDFRRLFEDEFLELNFDIHGQKFLISQKNKSPYSLQTLSAGYSAIMSIYADLVMKVKLQEIKPAALRGVVFIDEIDAHLHVSLQRKIFKFLKESFPSVQFIITTHSPFVLMSVDDAVIYDITKMEVVNNVSLYSYDAVLEGIFNVLPISLILEEKIKRLVKISDDFNKNQDEIKQLISQIKPMENNLDSESKFHFSQVEIKLIRESKNV